MNERPQTRRPATSGGEIDLRELFRVLWAGKWLIGGITFAATVITIVVALMLPNVYRAEALLVPNDQERAGGLSAMAAQYGGLASLAGINLGSGQVDKTALGLEILKSRKFISEFVERHDILVPLIAARGWNPETGELEIDPDIYDAATDKWVRDVRPPKKATPSSQDAYKVFSKRMSVSQDIKTGFVTLSFEHHSPAMSKQWVDWMIKDLNRAIMTQDVDEAQHAINYLRDQIESTSIADLRIVFSRLIEEQTKTVMLAKVSSEYMFRTVDPAVVPEQKAKPIRTLITLLGLFLGALAGMIVVFVRHGISSERA